MKGNDNGKPKLDRVSILCLIGFHAWGRWSESRRAMFEGFLYISQVRYCVQCNKRDTRGAV